MKFIQHIPIAKQVRTVVLILLCTAVSSCATTSLLSSDPKTAEDILRASTDHEARITFAHGAIANGYRVSVREDSTRWSLTKDGFGAGASVGAGLGSAPTNCVVSIDIPDPQIAVGVLVGVPAGALAGVLIAAATYTPPPPSPPGPLSGLSNSLAGLDGIDAAASGLLVGAVVGAIFGGFIGGINGTVWTRNDGAERPHLRKWDAQLNRWHYFPNDTTHANLPH